MEHDSHGPPLDISSNSEGLTLRSPARGTSLTIGRKIMILAPKEQFEALSKKEGFFVDFIAEIARVLEYRDSLGWLEFMTDSSERGDHSVTVEHHPKSWPRGERYHLAFSRCRQFLESCGFGFDEWPEAPNQSSQPRPLTRRG
jgi:hypothetical protein